jgi:hypothetical protein
MLVRIACLALAITALHMPPGWADNPDNFPPQQLAGDQPSSNETPACPGKFHFSSDVEDAGPGNITLNNLVLNEDSHELVYRWAKADRVRGVFNPLLQGATDENLHPIDDYKREPDRDAPIEYTPQKCIRTASIYVEIKPASSDSVWSSIKSTFKDILTGEIRDLVVEMKTVKEGDTLTYTIKADPPDIFVGLSGLRSNQLEAQAADQQVTVFPADLGKLLNSGDLASIPDSWPKTFTMFSFSQSKSGTVQLQLPAEKSVPSSEIMVILDTKQNLITTGRVSTLLPAE